MIIQAENSLVSVVLCFYNEEKFIREAIDSVLAQHYPRWELMLVDDGSSDASSGIAKEYCTRYPDRIFYIEHDGHVNKGLSASRNAGIARAQGEYVALIDADDVWLPNKLAHQLNVFHQNPDVTVVLESSLYWNSWTNVAAMDVEVAVGVAEGAYRPPALMLALYPLGTGAAPCPSGIIVKRAVFNRCTFESSFKGIYQMYEDQAFLCKVYLHEVVFVSAASHNRYRQRPSSLVSSVHDGGNYHTVRRYYLDWFEQYYHALSARFPAVTTLLHRALAMYRRPVWYLITIKIPRWMKNKAARVLAKLGILHYPKS